MVPGARQGPGRQALTAPSRLSAELSRLSAACVEKDITLRELVSSMDPRDQALLTGLLSVCFLHPVPMPGVSLVFGCVIAVAGARMALGLGFWMPKGWLDRRLPGKAMGKVFAASGRLMRKLEKVIKPRGRFLSAHPWTQRANGLAVAVCGVLLAAPFPPGTNAPPAAALLLLSIGILEQDLAFLVLGYAAFLANLAFFGSIGVLGWSGVRILLG